MEIKVTYTFTFKVEDRNYSFNEISDTKEAALETLKSDLIEIISNINLD